MFTSLTYWLLVLAGTIVCSLAGAFDTGTALSFMERLTYWFTIIVTTSVVGMSGAYIFKTELKRFGFNQAFETILCFLLTSPIVGITVHLLTAKVFKIPLTGLHVISIYSTAAVICFVVATTIVTTGNTEFPTKWLDLQEQDATTDSEQPTPPTTALSPPEPQNEQLSVLIAQLGEQLGDDIVYIQAQDHYLYVKTSLGSDTIFMRFRDAIHSLDPSTGMQVHRSWWVGFQHIDHSTGSTGRRKLHLLDGTIVPVSRKFDDDVKRHLSALQDNLSSKAENQ